MASFLNEHKKIPFLVNGITNNPTGLMRGQKASTSLGARTGRKVLSFKARHVVCGNTTLLLINA